MVEYQDNKHRYFYLKKIIKSWKEKNYNKYFNKLNELPTRIYLRIITNDYNIYMGLLTSIKDQKIKLKDTYNDTTYTIDFNQLIPTETETTDFNTTDFIGVYYNQDQLKKNKPKQTNYF